MYIFYRDRPKDFNPKDFIIENQKDVTLGRLPGKINGQQFIIQDCEVYSVHVEYRTITPPARRLHNNVTLGRLPGKINGQQFIIQDCEVYSVHV